MPTNTHGLTIAQRKVGQATELFRHREWFSVWIGKERLNVQSSPVKHIPGRHTEIRSVTFWEEGGPCTIFFALNTRQGDRLKVQQVLTRSEDEKQRFLSLSDEAQFQLFGF